MPTMSAPASWSARAASAARLAVGGHRLVLEADRDHHRQPRLLGALDGEQRLAEPRERLADHEVDALLDLHRELLVEGPAHAVVGGRAAVLVHPRQRQVAGDEAPVPRDLLRDADGGAVQVLEPVLEADRRELVAAGVEGQRLEYLGARLAELDVQLLSASGRVSATSGVNGPARTQPRFSSSSRYPPSPRTGPSASRSRIPFFFKRFISIGISYRAFASSRSRSV